MIVHLCVCCSS